MLIGVDASRAFVKDKTGTENYSYELLRAMLELPEAKKHSWRLYVKEMPNLESGVFQSSNLIKWVKIKWPRLWTQGGLAIECLKRPPEVLWVPAHTLPVIRWPSLKTVVTIHGIEYEYLPEYYQFPQSLYLNKSTEYAVRKADKLIAVSRWTKKQLIERLGADESKIEVVYEGISRQFRPQKPLELKRVRRKYNLPKDYLLFVGTIQPRKNLVRLIEAYSRAKVGSYLVIAGKDGWMSEEIYEAPRKYGVEDRVLFIGRVAEADLPAVYQMATVFVWPSLMEGFGLPILEAMQMGVPVVSSDRGAIPEVGGEAMIKVKPEKVENIAQAIKMVFEDRKLKKSLVIKGLKQVRKFSYAKAGLETLKILTSW